MNDPANGGRPPRDRREAEGPKGANPMAKTHSKRFRALAEKIERGREYPPDEAAKLIKETSQAKFDTTVERSEEHTSELQSQSNLVCRLLLEKKKKHK